MRQLASKAWQFVNVSWQMIGMTVLLCVLAECGYRAQASVREQLGGGVQHSYTDGDPQSRLPWHAPFIKEYVDTFSFCQSSDEQQPRRRSFRWGRCWCNNEAV